MSTITFIDYGNRAQVHVTKLAALPAQFSTAKLGAQANEYQLALVKPPSDEVRNLLRNITITYYNCYVITILGFIEYCFGRIFINVDRISLLCQ